MRTSVGGEYRLVVRFGVLGDVAVVGDDGVVTRVGAGKQRALLAFLILHANRVLSTAVLVDAVWGEALPGNPSGALQVLVSRLRSGLGPYGERVGAVEGGYRLDVAADETDVGLAEACLREGRVALGGGDGSGAAAVFNRGLSLWNGDPLVGLAGISFVEDAVRRLRELWLSLVEARNDALLVAGRHLEVLADIGGVVDAEPLREHLRAQQVAALYRAGRQAEALRACDALRNALRDELGLEASPAMQDLERRILDQDPSLLAVDAGFATPLPAWTTETLPFVGRDAERKQVLSWYGEAVREGVRVVLVEGTAGVGKSRFLLQIARQLDRDAIVLAVHVHDAFRSSLHELARVLAEANLRLSDLELQELIDQIPDLTTGPARVREVASVHVTGQPAKPDIPDEAFRQHVASWVAALSARAPVVIVVDDLDAGGSSFLRVVWQLTTLSVPKRVVIIGSIRTPNVEALPSGLARTLGALDRRGLLGRIELCALTRGDVEELLGRMFVTPPAGVVSSLYEMTSGNPYMLAETLSLGSPEHVIEQWSSPPRVRDLARQRSAELGRATAELLAQASLFETDFSLEALANAAGTTTGTAATLVDRAVAANVLQPSTLTSYRFAHQLFRHALLADLTVTQRAIGHRNIANALEATGAPPAVLATHWSGSSGPDVPERVVRYATAAAREAMRLLEPHTAVRWFTIALEHLPEGRERHALLVELALAQQLAGDPAGHATLQQEVQHALATHDDELTLQIVRTSGPGWITWLIPGAGDLQDRALEIVTDDATHARILARQAVNLIATDPATAERTADNAVLLARESHDPAALAEALLRQMSASLSPHSLADRQHALPELLQVSLQSADIPTRYFALSTAVVTAIQAGDLAQVNQYSAEADAIAFSYDLAPMRWSAMVRRAWKAGLAGRHEHAEALIEAARTYGTGAGIAGAQETALMQLGLLRWQQERVPEVLPAVRHAFDDPNTTIPGVALVLARALAANPTGQDEARELLTTFADDTFNQLRRGPFWSSALILTAETAHLVDLPDISRVIRDLLLPYADQVAFTGSWVTAPIAYGIGIAMTGCHDPRANQLLEHSTTITHHLNDATPTPTTPKPNTHPQRPGTIGPQKASKTD